MRYTALVTGTLRIIHALEKNRLNTGSVVQMLAAARGLAGRGHRVTVLSRAGGDLETACATAGLDFWALGLSNQFDLASAMALRRYLVGNPVDLIHVHKGRPHAIALLAAAGLGPRPLLVVNRGVSFPLDVFNKWKYRHPRVAAVVCVAEAIREVVIASGGLRPERVHTIHAATDSVLFDPRRVDSRAVRDELGVRPEQLLIGQVSVRDWKGWRELLAAFARIRPASPQARLLLVGCEEGSRHKVVAAARELAVGDGVFTLPYRSDMPEVLAACDLVVDASWAGTGITGTVREAMAMARAVVATNCAGNRELVANEKVGLLVPPRDIGALANALGRLLAAKSLRISYGEAGRATVLAKFSTATRIDRLEGLYARELLAVSN